MNFALCTVWFARIFGLAGVGLLALLLIPNAAQAGDTFAKIRATGAVRCGVSDGDLTGFSQKDAQGRWTGLNVDCSIANRLSCPSGKLFVL